ncbi:hypothetical protein NUU61_005175 [Penicillium alfredii]|uniref:Alpha,alpha-trehalose phosphate synthase subunit n=1 Tax=Penicillium alfredii TaxID=1506179 RepID=A0A9W9K7C6_9EURO|nr:uncharacterized protein NUU61_005175 [Penicillium alfredii]KAJ5095819.1 hypothetical protein NUU61_005175 [Penicillium alfredii]
MTVIIASLFLPYTIDFKDTESRNGRRKSSVSYSVDEPTAENLADAHYRPRLRSGSQSLTPGATTEDEKIFKAYASRSAGEIQSADDPNGPGPSEPRAVCWGQSRKFNQPQSKATTHPEPSILSRPNSQQDLTREGSPSRPDAESQGSPSALLSAVDWVVKAAEQGHGGLQNAIYAAEEAGMLADKMWVGTLGMPTDSLTDQIQTVIAETLKDQYESLTVFVDDSEFEGHYAHFCRAVLWPALHYQMQESPRHTEYDDYSWKQYLKVNEAFANAIAIYWRPDDRIWVHDYHLLALPSLLRKRLPRAEIGFFMHAAFPSSEVFRCLNSRESLLDGLLGADLVGFQTEEYCHHFLHTCSRLRRLEVSVDGVQVNDRFVHVKPFPLGVDYRALNALRRSVEVKNWITNISERYQGKHLIVARDRLDAPGGIKQKFLAYELFLDSYPKWRENVVLVQVASSASEIPELEAQVSKIAMRINSIYSTLTHQPLVLLRQDISYSQFLALLSVADIFMATNLREGMNLTSHDFIHCQDGELASQRHGSLILSEFVGSASIFHGHELLVNPWDYKQCADAINTALGMSPEQKQRNWQFLLTRKSPLHRAGLARILAERALQSTQPAALPRNAPDGALLGADESIPSNEAIATLHGLANNPANTIYLTSHRSQDQLQETAKHLLPQGIGLIAENGCFIQTSGHPEAWEALVNVEHARTWRTGIRKVMEYFSERTEGSRIEERRCSLTFHYDGAVDRAVAARQASELADQINGACGSEPIRVVRDIAAVSVEPLHASKAAAAAVLLDRWPGTSSSPDFVFVAGGARGDEALFRWANSLAAASRHQMHQDRSRSALEMAMATLTVGSHATEARAVLPPDSSLLDVLRMLSGSENEPEHPEG